jgi:glycosyltransferase involved in cell wall biosynthesis
VVPIGLWYDEVDRYDMDEINRHELVFIGHLVPKAGVDLVIEAMPRILEEIPDFTFRVIGHGEYRKALEETTERLGVGDHVIFEGGIHDQAVANEKLARAAVAVAMYDRTADDFTFFADPGKLKTYLSVGLPILLSELPHNAALLEERGCARIVEYDPGSIATAVIEMMNDNETLAGLRRCALECAREYDWNRIFTENFGRML